MLLRDLLKGEDPQIGAIAEIIIRAAPDVILLTEFDYDADGHALAEFAATLESLGAPYPYRLAWRPNSGAASGLDLDGNGFSGEPRDAQGYGKFAGDDGMAVLSRVPIDAEASRDLSALVWRDLPWATLPNSGGKPFPSEEAQAIQRLSTTGHWIITFEPEGAARFDLLAFSATPPVFDGPEDRNGLRNRDEILLWTHVLDQDFGPLNQDFLVAGNANLDPADGDGLRNTILTVLADPRLQDPRPQSRGGKAAADAEQTGDPALDTADWPDGAPGNLRVSYVLPSAGWQVGQAGVFWPAPDDPDAALLGPDGQAAGPHRLVWVEVSR